MIMLFTGERKRGAQKDTEDPNSHEGGVMYTAKLWQKKIFTSTLTSLAPFFVMQIVSTGTGFTLKHWTLI